MAPPSLHSSHRAAVRHLKKVDPRMRRLIEDLGSCDLTFETDAWCALASSIIGQQISVHAARAIRGRFAQLNPATLYPSPAYILAASEELLRSVGLSANKVRSIKDLAIHFIDKKIDPEKFARMEDEDIIEALVDVRGIGRWTAEMFLLFSMGRADIFALDDLGLRNGINRSD